MSIDKAKVKKKIRPPDRNRTYTHVLPQVQLPYNRMVPLTICLYVWFLGTLITADRNAWVCWNSKRCLQDDQHNIKTYEYFFRKKYQNKKLLNIYHGSFLFYINEYWRRECCCSAFGCWAHYEWNPWENRKVEVNGNSETYA